MLKLVHNTLNINLKNSHHMREPSKHYCNTHLVIGKQNFEKRLSSWNGLPLHFIEGLRKLYVFLLLTQTSSPHDLFIWKKKFFKYHIPGRFFSFKNTKEGVWNIPLQKKKKWHIVTEESKVLSLLIGKFIMRFSRAYSIVF